MRHRDQFFRAGDLFESALASSSTSKFSPLDVAVAVFRAINEYENLLGSLCDWNTPDNAAIEYHNAKSEKVISYAELNEAKIRVEEALGSLCCGKTYGFIGISADVREYCVPALSLGINSSGNAFVNLPSDSNIETLRRLRLRYTFSKVSISGFEFVGSVVVHGETLRISKCQNITDSGNVKNEFAYAVTTSGSTGVPKIVRVPHRCIAPNIVDFCRILEVGRDDKVAQITKLTFDPSIVEIFLSLSSGSTLFVPSTDLKNEPNRLLTLIFERGVTVLQTTPSLWHQRWSKTRVNRTILGPESRLKTLLLGGEPFPKIETLVASKHPKNRTSIYNIYGITEVSCWASIKEVDLEGLDSADPDRHRDLGAILSETMFDIRNVHGKSITSGEGLLYVGSGSRKCLVDNEPSTFLRCPVFRKTGDVVTIANGVVRYVGRCDRTIKRYGNRLNLNQLETEVSQANGVKSCVALWDEEGSKLNLGVLLEDRDELSNQVDVELKDRFKKLPSFWKPDKIKYFDHHFVLTEHGKICMKSLAQFFEGNEHGNTIIDKDRYVEIRTKLLIATRDGFFNSGGTSITALQLSNELAAVYKGKVEFPELIGLLLTNSDSDICLAYVTRQIEAASHRLTEVETDSTPPHAELLPRKKIKLSSDETREEIAAGAKIYQVSNSDQISWQKCRGNVIGDLPVVNSFPNSARLKLTVDSVYDLKKCVDASPTVFAYQSGEIYASVGSHSGIILTTRTNHPNPIVHKIQLPDRIEASVLVLDNFSAVVGSYDGFVYKVNLRTGEIIWKFKTGDAVKCTAHISNDKKCVIVGSYDRHLYSLRIEDGSKSWKVKASNGSISAIRLAPNSNSIFFGTLDGCCVSCDQSSGKMLWKKTLEQPFFSAPGILRNGNVVFCSVSGAMKSYDSMTGAEAWNFKIDGNVFSHLVVAIDETNDMENIIFGCMNKRVYCLTISPFAGEPILRYSVSFAASVYATPCRQGNILVAVDVTGNLSLLNVTDGSLLASAKLSGDVFSSPVINDDSIVVGCRDNHLYIVQVTE